MRGDADVIRTRCRVQLRRDGLSGEANRVSDFEQYLGTTQTQPLAHSSISDVNVLPEIRDIDFAGGAARG